MVGWGPYSGGQSFQRQPLRSTCRMPLITLRSSTRSLPRTSVGRCGSICCHCSSFSQNRFDRIFSAPLTAENQQPILAATLLLGFSPRRGKKDFIFSLPLAHGRNPLKSHGRENELYFL